MIEYFIKSFLSEQAYDLWVALNKPDDWAFSDWVATHKPSGHTFWIGDGPQFFDGVLNTPSFTRKRERIILWMRAGKLYYNYLNVSKYKTKTENIKSLANLKEK